MVEFMYIKKSIYFILILLAAVFLNTAVANAQGASPRANLERFYKPITSNELFVNLPPRITDRNRFSANGNFISGENGCPDEIIIGSITDDSSVFGGADIDVAIDGDIIIQCGGF